MAKTVPVPPTHVVVGFPRVPRGALRSYHSVIMWDGFWPSSWGFILDECGCGGAQKFQKIVRMHLKLSLFPLCTWLWASQGCPQGAFMCFQAQIVWDWGFGHPRGHALCAGAMCNASIENSENEFSIDSPNFRIQNDHTGWENMFLQKFNGFCRCIYPIFVKNIASFEKYCFFKPKSRHPPGKKQMLTGL